MEVTELEMVIDVNPLQPENAWEPMEVTELGMLIDFNPLQPENALPAMTIVSLLIVHEEMLKDSDLINAWCELPRLPR